MTSYDVIMGKNASNRLNNTRNVLFVGENPQNRYTGNFQATKTYDFRDFIEIRHKMTSFMTSYDVIIGRNTSDHLNNIKK